MLNGRNMFKLFKPHTVKNVMAEFELLIQDGRIWMDFKGQHVERLSFEPELARAVAKALLEKADRIDKDRAVVVT